jgi:hypothetical protein
MVAAEAATGTTGAAARPRGLVVPTAAARTAAGWSTVAAFLGFLFDDGDGDGDGVGLSFLLITKFLLFNVSSSSFLLVEKFLLQFLVRQ